MRKAEVGERVIETHEWKRSKIVWVVGREGIMMYAWVCVHSPEKWKAER